MATITCPVLLLNNSPCDKPTLPGFEWCPRHYHNKNINMDGCNFIRTAGKNKGEMCGKKCKKGENKCTTHVKLLIEQERTARIRQLMEGLANGATVRYTTVVKNDQEREGKITGRIITRGKAARFKGITVAGMTDGVKHLMILEPKHTLTLEVL